MRAAEARAAEARRAHASAQHRLDTAPRRQRRIARHELDLTERRLERAEYHLTATRERTRPAVDEHTRAVASRQAAHEQLRTCDAGGRLHPMAPSVAELRTRVRALETWKLWADGHPVPDRALRTVAAVFNQRTGIQRQLAAALSDHIHQPTHRKARGMPHQTPTRNPEPEFGIGR